MNEQTIATPRPMPADWVRRLRAYSSQKTDAPIDLKLDANEGPIRNRSVDELIGAPALRNYPSKSQLEQQIATRYGIEADQALVTCGGDDAIDRVCRAFLQTGRNIVVPQPTFVMIGQYATMAGGEVRSVPWPDGEFPVAAIRELADPQTAVIAVVSPNNPTAAIVTADQLRALAASCPQALLLVDQAYAEFEDRGAADHRESLTEVALRELPSAIVVRTFSKAWGLAGLRVGYALGPSKLIEWLRRAGSPYPVSSPSLAVAAWALNADPAGQTEYIQAVLRERTALQRLLRELGADALPSQANFVFARFPSPLRNAAFVCDALATLGISVRSFSALPDALRITCPGDAAAFDRLCAALRTILAPQAVLFDLDGVLADETPSYREAIRLTCESYGQTITTEEIAAAKLLGDTNNDWEFTQWLLRQRQVACEFEEVKRRFELFYQGDETTPGLWQRETRLVDRDWLQQLARRYPLAIVTGRPRQDALRFLEAHDFTGFFSAIVCMEDGPAKPDPTPVQTALEQLGVTAAWMIGDTPDDIAAARRARVLPLGIVAAHHDTEFATTKLQAAFATRIINLQSLSEILP